MIAETANWFFTTFVINLLPDSLVQNVNLIKFRDAIFLYLVDGPMELHWSKRVNERFR